ncbi:MAG: hypothetical protein IH939_11710, partial [Acidobacteria bacterium]|nr:hypothetical protein [Acidobacteriota bacterium]
MWQLFGDQLNRNRSVAITFAAILLVVPLLSALLPLLDIQGKGILYFFFCWMLFWAGFVGVGNTMADRKGLRVMRALPVRSRDTAWASWLGATAPGVLIGVVACGALPVLDAVPGFATEFPVARDQLIGLGAVTVVWACGLAGIAWGLMMVVARHDPRPAIGVGAFLFIVAYIAVLAPIWVGAVAPGWSLRDAFEAEQAVLLFVVVGLALGSFALS